MRFTCFDHGYFPADIVVSESAETTAGHVGTFIKEYEVKFPSEGDALFHPSIEKQPNIEKKTTSDVSLNVRDGMVPDPLYVVIAHSFGLHKISDEVLSKADIIIIFGGFNQFEPAYVQSQRSPLRVMLEAWPRNRKAVLQQFYRNVFWPDTVQISYLPHNLIMDSTDDVLLHDLQKMGSSRINHAIFDRIPAKLHIQGNLDRIVSMQTAKLFNREFPGMTFVLYEGAGHAIPATQADIAASDISRFIFENS